MRIVKPVQIFFVNIENIVSLLILALFNCIYNKYKKREIYKFKNKKNEKFYISI